MDLWKQRIHVKSSLQAKTGQFSMFVGRWQPFHLAHAELFAQAMQDGKNVLICIRDGEINEKNPFSAQEVLENISNHYASLIKKGRVKVMIIPDICSIEFGRAVGYDVIEHIPPSELAEISATKIRKNMQNEGRL